MKYYRVKKEFDGKRRSDGSIYIMNELYTEKEAQKMKLNYNYMEQINVSKKSVYFFFGARFTNSQI